MYSKQIGCFSLIFNFHIIYLNTVFAYCLDILLIHIILWAKGLWAHWK